LGLVSVIDLSDINNIRLKTRGGPDVLFGQSDQPESKMYWMMRILPSMIAEGTTQGIVDVSAGSFATYRMEGDGTATPDNTDTPDDTDIEDDADTPDNTDTPDDTDTGDNADTPETGTNGE
jgi:hypothetical protein